MLLNLVNVLTLARNEEELRQSVKTFAEKHELDKFFLYGFGSHVANTISTCINATRATPKW